jgi:hypothetical protein
MRETTFKVMVRRTVQVKQYEPTTVELSMEGVCDREQVTTEYGKAFKEIKAEMKKIFGEKKEADMGVLG